MNTNFDFNSILNNALNTLISNAVTNALSTHFTPLLDRISILEKENVELNAFLNQWNFNEKGFDEAVLKLIKNDMNVGDAIMEIANEAASNALDNYAVTDALGDAIDEKVTKAVESLDVYDAVKEALSSIDLGDMLGDAIDEKVTEAIDDYDMDGKIGSFLRNSVTISIDC